MFDHNDTTIGKVNITRRIEDKDNFDLVPKDDITMTEIAGIWRLLKISTWGLDIPESIARHFVKKEDS